MATYAVPDDPHSAARVVCDCLLALDDGSIDARDIQFGARRIEPTICKQLLTKYLLNNTTTSSFISFATMTMLLDVLAVQLRTLTTAVFFKVENSQVPGVRRSVSESFIAVAKQFVVHQPKRATLQQALTSRLASTGEPVLLEQDIDVPRWEECAYFFVMFHADGNCITVLRANRTKLAAPLQQYLDSQTQRNTAGQRMLQNELRMPLEELSPEQLGDKLQLIAGRLPEQEGDYVMTVDNLLKMGCGKTSLLRTLANAAGIIGNRFQILNVHASVTEEQIVAFVEQAQQLAITAEQGDVPRHLNTSNHGLVWVFLDEINTCMHMGLMNSLLCHRQLNGRPLHTGLVLLAACNPYVLRETIGRSVGLVHADVQQDAHSKLLYDVQPLPDAMLQYVWDYGVLDNNTERSYIRAMVTLAGFGRPSPWHRDLLVDLLSRTQQEVRATCGDWSVSLRDVQRCIALVAWLEDFLMTTQLGMKTGTNGNSNGRTAALTFHERAIMHALTTCYQLRLPPASHGMSATDYPILVARQFVKHKVPCSNDAPSHVMRETELALLDAMELPQRIAKNRALRENVFVNMRGMDSSRPMFAELPEVAFVSFQGSESSTSDGIQQVFQRAHEKLERANNPGNTVAGTSTGVLLPVVFLDELRLAELSRHKPLKVLHSLLEPTTSQRSQVAVVGISNWSLDASKMNRAIHISRHAPDQEDLAETAADMRH
eukprot:jgi/Chlat1/7600/Chrsp64S07155